ncbi:MAG: GntR family transcriptional regulator [Bacteroidota bacterium]|nr:GntR family transcriptional regulator [Bacteroidota bacterium]MDP4230381.1 GntR family transcriptional regulator [Bacteroidota bacterium]MDP4237561.1 GntR family transcriptional regulator [Bacteroidota bacterium]
MNFSLDIDPSSPLPIYAQLGQGIRGLIARGTLREGDQLPTVREMAVRLKINANTVAKVYAELEGDGVLATKRGVGTFITKPDKKESARDRKRELAELSEKFVTASMSLGFSIEEIIQSISSQKTVHKKGG